MAADGGSREGRMARHVRSGWHVTWRLLQARMIRYAVGMDTREPETGPFRRHKADGLGFLKKKRKFAKKAHLTLDTERGV